MRLNILLALSCLPLALAACHSAPEEKTDSAADFASRIGAAPATGTAAPAQRNPALANLPKVAAEGKKAVQYTASYTQKSAGGSENGLKFGADGTFVLTENGQTTKGSYEWLPDGKRLRLKGVENRPIVLIADGAIYRMANEQVPIDDVTPDRMFAIAGAEQPSAR